MRTDSGAGASPRASSWACRFVLAAMACSGLGAASVPSVAFGADTCPNASARSGLSAELSRCRAYEMVSPLDKNGGDIDRDAVFASYATSGASVAGDAVAYASQSQFAGDVSGAAYVQYRSTRTAGGWDTRSVNPPLATAGPINNSRIQLFSPDLMKRVVQVRASLTPGAGAKLGGSFGLYLRDDTGPATAYTLLSDPFEPLVGPDEAAFIRFQPAAATPDFSHIVFSSQG